VGLALLCPGVASGAAVTADLSITNTADVSHARVGQDVTFTSVVTNDGPDTVLSFYVNRTHGFDPSTLDLGTLRLVGGDCDFTVTGDGPFCEYGYIFAPGETIAQTLVGEVVATGSNRASNTACAEPFSPEELIDPNPANDCATATVKIVGRKR
jgi:hypothetical protein